MPESLLHNRSHILYHWKAQICVAVCSLPACGGVTKPLQFVALPEAAGWEAQPAHSWQTFMWRRRCDLMPCLPEAGNRGTLKMSWVSSRDPWHFKCDSDQLMGISMKGVGRLWLKFNILKLSLHMMTMMWPDSIFFQWQVKGDWQNQIHSHSPATDLEYRAVCYSLQCNSN